MKKLSNTEAGLEKIFAYKKKRVTEIIDIYLQSSLNNCARALSSLKTFNTSKSFKSLSSHYIIS